MLLFLYLMYHRRLKVVGAMAAGWLPSHHNPHVEKIHAGASPDLFFILWSGLFLGGFFDAFHNSELLSASCSDFSGCALATHDISVIGLEMHIQLWGSKTDGHSPGTYILLYSSPSPALFSASLNIFLSGLMLTGLFCCMLTAPSCQISRLLEFCMCVSQNKLSPKWFWSAFIPYWGSHTDHWAGFHFRLCS